MFSVESPEQQCPLQQFLFDRVRQVVAEDDGNINWDISAESKLAKMFIDDCSEYLKGSRVKLEHKVLFIGSKTAHANLDRSDEFYMKGIIENRKYIFTH